MEAFGALGALFESKRIVIIRSRCQEARAQFCLLTFKCTSHFARTLTSVRTPADVLRDLKDSLEQ